MAGNPLDKIKKFAPAGLKSFGGGMLLGAAAVVALFVLVPQVRDALENLVPGGDAPVPPGTLPGLEHD